MATTVILLSFLSLSDEIFSRTSSLPPPPLSASNRRFGLIGGDARMINNDPLCCLIHSPDPAVTLDQREDAREGDPGSPEQMVKEVEREAGGPPASRLYDPR